MCWRHGGNYPRAKAKSERAKQERAVRSELDRLGEPIDVDSPIELFLNLIQVSAGHVRFLREQVQRAESAEDLVWGTGERIVDEEHGTKTTERASPNVWLKLWNEERDRLAGLIERGHKMGIEEKRLELAEILGAQLLQTLELQTEAIFDFLAASGWDREELDEVRAEAQSTAIRKALEVQKQIDSAAFDREEAGSW